VSENTAKTLDQDDRAFVLETLRQEAMELFQQQRAIADKGARALALGATVLAGFAAYGIAGKATGHELLLRALPVAVALIGIELAQNFIAEGRMARARLAIEDALCCDLGVRVLVYEKDVRLRTIVGVSALVSGAAFVGLYVLVALATQLPDVHANTKAHVANVDDIVFAARVATVLTGLALFVILVIGWRDQRASNAPPKIRIPGRREAPPSCV
jgi:hypothetical protein